MFNKEPAVIIGLVQTVLALVVSFGLDLSTDQVGSIMALSAAVLAFVTRSQVVPFNQVEPNDPVEFGP